MMRRLLPLLLIHGGLSRHATTGIRSTVTADFEIVEHGGVAYVSLQADNRASGAVFFDLLVLPR